MVDDFNREVLSITVDTSLPSQRVIRDLETLVDWRGKPDTIRLVRNQWHKLDSYIAGQATQNNLIERFNRTFRQDVLDSYMFDNLAELRKYALALTEYPLAWAWMYNNERPHAALGYRTLVEVLLKYGKLSVLNKCQFPTLQ